MGITIGPMIAEIFNIMIPAKRAENRREKPTEIWLAPDSKEKIAVFPEPCLNFLEIIHRLRCRLFCNFSLHIYIFPGWYDGYAGWAGSSRKKELFDRVTTTLGVQDAVSNATYLGELLIPMIGIWPAAEPGSFRPGISVIQPD